MSISAQNPVTTLETTGCERRMEEVTRTHMFRIVGYSLEKHIGKGKFLESTNFDVGGHDWSIKYYPNGYTEAGNDDISIYLFLNSTSDCVRAQFSFAILDQSGCVLTMRASVIRNFSSFTTSWGYLSFAKRTELDSYIKDDCFVIKSVISVFKAFPVEPNAPIVVPPGKIVEQLGHLLVNGYGADVTFEVDGQTLRAHKCILAVRSPVFLAQFFGPMKEKSADSIIKIEEMEPAVFKCLLHFIYNDSFPEFEDIKGSDEKHDTKLMAQHLLVAADIYGLDRLKIICEKILCGSIDTNNVATLLSFAERHYCNHLKETCLKFLALPGNLKKLAGTEQFQYLVNNDPLILKELLEKQG